MGALVGTDVVGTMEGGSDGTVVVGIVVGPAVGPAVGVLVGAVVVGDLVGCCVVHSQVWPGVRQKPSEQ